MRCPPWTVDKRRTVYVRAFYIIAPCFCVLQEHVRHKKRYRTSGLYPRPFHTLQAIRLKNRHAATSSPQLGTWCLNSQAFTRMNSVSSFFMALPPSVHVTAAPSLKSYLMAIFLTCKTDCLEGQSLCFEKLSCFNFQIGISPHPTLSPKGRGQLKVD